MIELYLDDDNTITMLEYCLIKLGERYKKNLYDPQSNLYGAALSTPFLVVDGVPLDAVRAIQWITDKM